jgi:hypothetical protein
MKEKAILRSGKNLLGVAIPIVLLQVCLFAVIHAQEVSQTPRLPLPSPDSAEQPSAMTLSVRGDCDHSENGVTFTKLARTDILDQGAIIRTGEDARADLFFRRTGTTVRLQGGTEIELEKMNATMKDSLPIVHTLLDLRKGRIFIVVRSAVAGSTLEIRNAAGRSVVEGSGIGSYIITADGTHVSAEGSVIPLKVIGENGITIVAAGQQFDRKDGKMLPTTANSWVKELIELDELEAAAGRLAAEKPSPRP